MHQLQIKIYTPQELNHSSYVQTGLFELEKEGFLKTHVKISFAKRLGTLRIEDSKIVETSQAHPKTSFYELNDLKSGKKILFATDLYDASTSFSMYALEHCDFVFKRNYKTKDVNRLPMKFQNKIFRLGLTFRVYSKSKKLDYKFFLGIIGSNLLINLKADSQVFTRLKNCFTKQVAHWNFVKTTRSIEEFENYEKATEPFILFQTRCFLNENDQDLKQIHLDRYNIIHLLRNKFPNLYRGGLISSKIVEQYYSDALSNLKTDPKSYLDLVKKVKIAIYTRGIQDSPAWKMAEYLSQGKIVIAEKIRTELPIPLEHQKHVMFFESIEEIPLLCEQVLNDEKLSKCLSENGRFFYENNISPKVNIKRIIDFMLEHSKK